MGHWTCGEMDVRLNGHKGRWTCDATGVWDNVHVGMSTTLR